METVLLADDETLFKAVEGTCLRRERCRLLKAFPVHFLDLALAERPDLMILSLADSASRGLLRDVHDAGALASVPIIVLDFADGTVRFEPVKGAGGRKGALDILPVGRRPSGRADLPDLDTRLDAAIKRHLPILDRKMNRVAVSVPVRCRGGDDLFTVSTKDLSPTGLFLKTDRPLDPGNHLEVSFRLPVPVVKEAEADGAGGAPRRVSGTCEVVRRVGLGGLDDPDLIPGVGVRFIDIGEEGSSVLSRFVHGSGQKPSARGGRAAPRAPGPR